MDEMKLRGYVTPEEFEGTDAEKIQAAIKTAFEKDIRKVILKGEYKVDKTVYIYEQMHLVFDGATLTATGDFPLFANYAVSGEKQLSYSFQEDMFFLEGKNDAVLNGSLLFDNGYRIVIENLEINGDASFEFSKEIRFEHNKLNGIFYILRGSNSFIVQYNDVKAFVIDSADTAREYCIGKEPFIRELIIKENNVSAPVAFKIDATEEARVLNVVIEDNKVADIGLLLGEKSGELNPYQYSDITAVGFNCSADKAVILKSETRHCLFGK